MKPSPAVPSTKRAVVVGGGPAGCLTSMLLSQQGWQVQMLELRDRDGAIGSMGKMRSWCLGMFPRGINAIKKAVPDADQRHFRERTYKSLILHKADGSPGVTLSRTGALCHRFGVAALLTEAMEERGLVPPVYGARFVGADFAARTATFEVAEPATSSGSSSSGSVHEGGTEKRRRLVLPYDLLVGADGSSSSVRGALMQAFPGQLRFDMISKSEGKIYKTFFGLPADPLTLTWEPCLPALKDPLPDADSVAAAAGPSAAGTQQPRWPAAGSASDPGISFHVFRGRVPGANITLSFDVDTGTYSGYLPTTEELMPSPHDSEEAWLKYLGEAFVPPLPASWHAPLAQQLAKCPVSKFTSMQLATTFGVPGTGCVLIGDAAACSSATLRTASRLHSARA